MKQVSSINPDWDRERTRKFWDPGRKLLKSIRDYQRYKYNSGLFSSLKSKICVIRHSFWSTVSGADIPLTSNIGGGLLIPHPNGIVIHPDAKIGVNCLILQQVTIGVSNDKEQTPIIAGHVDIGAGAKVIGNLVVNEHAIIGANAVVTKDVERYDIVAGIPAKKIGKNSNNGK